eukprot:60991-Chlamydomonas_euryale.AAC.3
MFEDPVQHESICVMNAVTVDAFEVIVVYTEDTQASVEERVHVEDVAWTSSLSTPRMEVKHEGVWKCGTVCRASTRMGGGIAGHLEGRDPRPVRRCVCWEG